MRAYEIQTGKTCPPGKRGQVLHEVAEAMAALDTMQYDGNPKDMPHGLRTFQADMDYAHTHELLSKALDPKAVIQLFADPDTDPEE